MPCSSKKEPYGPAMSDTNTLYDEDFFAWTKQQAKALRAAARSRTNQPLDWTNLAEEIEDLGKSQRRELGSRIREIVEHLVKLQRSPALEPRPGWRASIRRQRAAIEDLLRDSPSLEREVDEIIRAQAARGTRMRLPNCRTVAKLPRVRAGARRNNQFFPSRAHRSSTTGSGRTWSRPGAANSHTHIGGDSQPRRTYIIRHRALNRKRHELMA
jgi:hypothetical protein